MGRYARGRTRRRGTRQGQHSATGPGLRLGGRPSVVGSVPSAVESEGSSCFCAFACGHKDVLLMHCKSALVEDIGPKTQRGLEIQIRESREAGTGNGRPLRPFRRSRDSRVSSRCAPSRMELTGSDRRQPGRGDKRRGRREKPGGSNEDGRSWARRGRSRTLPQGHRTGHQLRKAASPLGSGRRLRRRYWRSLRGTNLRARSQVSSSDPSPHQRTFIHRSPSSSTSWVRKLSHTNAGPSGSCPSGTTASGTVHPYTFGSCPVGGGTHVTWSLLTVSGSPSARTV